MSPAEALLWSALRKRPGGYRFRKQHPIGRISLDFCCLESRLDIEVDGNAHDLIDRADRDMARERWLHELGFRTLRIPAVEIFRNLESAIMAVVEACQTLAPPRNGEGDRGAQRRGGGAECR
ncbi:endonuclease domain-containing protein [Sphingomonas changbaiensis]|uniref:endonuclease domain-containing protein n=1 Tax=Sphingomonas changbaiensis TaxID=529705 RepID=UPI0034E1D251